MQVQGKAYNISLSLMPPDPHISHISLLWQSLCLSKHHLQQYISSAVHSAHWKRGGVSDGVLALSSCVFSGQEQLLKCYPTILSKHMMFHNWLSCPMFCFTAACDLTLTLRAHLPVWKWTWHIIRAGEACMQPLTAFLDVAKPGIEKDCNRLLYMNIL